MKRDEFYIPLLASNVPYGSLGLEILRCVDLCQEGSKRLVSPTDQESDLGIIPSRKLTYPTWGSLENHRLKYANHQGDMYPFPGG